MVIAADIGSDGTLVRVVQGGFTPRLTFVNARPLPARYLLGGEVHMAFQVPSGPTGSSHKAP